MRRFVIADLYGGNPISDFDRLTASVDGVMLKVTEGVTWDDSSYALRVRALRRRRVRVGHYHYARPFDNNARAEAEHFARRVGKLDRRDLRPALDFEQPLHRRVTTDYLEGWIRGWNHAVRELLGVWPLFYSYPAYIEGLHLRRSVGVGLWLAQYGRDNGVDYGYQVPAPFRMALLHQFSSHCLLPGVEGRVDLSHTTRLGPLLAHPVIGRL